MIIQYFEYSFSDNRKAIICSTKYISKYFHGSFTLTILCGSVCIRSMMVKYADNIRTNNLDCKSHQAYLSDIETKTVLNLESDQIQEYIPNENDTDNVRENHEQDQSHEFRRTIQCSCGEKAVSSFIVIFAKHIFVTNVKLDH